MLLLFSYIFLLHFGLKQNSFPQQSNIRTGICMSVRLSVYPCSRLCLGKHIDNQMFGMIFVCLHKNLSVRLSIFSYTRLLPAAHFFFMMQALKLRRKDTYSIGDVVVADMNGIWPALFRLRGCLIQIQLHVDGLSVHTHRGCCLRVPEPKLNGYSVS